MSLVEKVKANIGKAALVAAIPVIMGGCLPVRVHVPTPVSYVVSVGNGRCHKHGNYKHCHGTHGPHSHGHKKKYHHGHKYHGHKHGYHHGHGHKHGHKHGYHHGHKHRIRIRW